MRDQQRGRKRSEANDAFAYRHNSDVQAIGDGCILVLRIGAAHGRLEEVRQLMLVQCGLLVQRVAANSKAVTSQRKSQDSAIEREKVAGEQGMSEFFTHKLITNDREAENRGNSGCVTIASP